MFIQHLHDILTGSLAVYSGGEATCRLSDAGFIQVQRDVVIIF